MSDAIEELRQTITRLKEDNAAALSAMRDALAAMDSLAGHLGPETMRFQRDQLRQAIGLLSRRANRPEGESSP